MSGKAGLQGFRGRIVSVPHDPREAGDEAVRHEPDGLLVVEDGRVAARGGFEGLAPRFPGLAIQTFPGGLIVPGFIDAHVHYPQTDAVASHGHGLLEWLDHHIFPAEAAFSDPGHARATADFFLAELLRNGTTSALVFATVHPASVDALFEAALARDMRVICGKTLMDLGPVGLHDTPPEARADSEALIARWRGRGRLGYAVTPRFALSCSDAELEVAGGLLRDHPDALLHTHLSENLDETARVGARFPQADGYLDVYDRFGLVGPRSVFAHGVHLEAAACRRLAEARSGLAFCPSSNLFLGSGLFDLAQADRHGLAVAVGTDVGAGTSFSMLHTLGEAYKVCRLRGEALNPFRALHMATTAGARILRIDGQVGALEVGQEADFVVLDPAATPLLARRTAGASLFETLFALQILGDDRAVRATWLAGRPAHRRDPP